MKLPIELSVQQWNVVINAVAQRPYIEVAEIIGEIKGQSEARLVNMNKVAQAFTAGSMTEEAAPKKGSK
jgi:hypothetical protein